MMENKNTMLYDNNGRLIFDLDRNGFWIKRKYDDYDNLVYFENSDGLCIHNVYDNDGNLIRSEHSDGYWMRRRFDEHGQCLYTEDSDGRYCDGYGHYTGPISCKRCGNVFEMTWEDHLCGYGCPYCERRSQS